MIPTLVRYGTAVVLHRFFMAVAKEIFSLFIREYVFVCLSPSHKNPRGERLETKCGDKTVCC